MLRVALHRVLLKFGIHPVQKVKNNQVIGIFFLYPTHELLNANSKVYSIDRIEKGFYPFSGEFVSFGSDIPNWHKNYFNNQESSFKNVDWWKISDFDDELGDIKTVWELSRFDWVVQLSIIASTGKKEAIDLLNHRLNNWIKENPFYTGIN